jgi:DNA polymerase-3 subunit alpha
VRDRIEKNGMTIKKIREEIPKGTEVTFACIVDEVKVILTKNNERMAFITLTDLTGTIEGVMFTKPFALLYEILVADTVLAVVVRVSERNGEKSIVVEKAKTI